MFNNELFLLPAETDSVIFDYQSLVLLVKTRPQTRLVTIQPPGGTQQETINIPELIWCQRMIPFSHNSPHEADCRCDACYNAPNYSSDFRVFFLLEKDKLTAYQLGNTASDGYICWGKNTPYNLRDAHNKFWSTPFNMDYYNRAHRIESCSNRQHKCENRQKSEYCDIRASLTKHQCILRKQGGRIVHSAGCRCCSRVCVHSAGCRCCSRVCDCFGVCRCCELTCYCPCNCDIGRGFVNHIKTYSPKNPTSNPSYWVSGLINLQSSVVCNQPVEAVFVSADEKILRKLSSDELHFKQTLAIGWAIRDLGHWQVSFKKTQLNIDTRHLNVCAPNGRASKDMPTETLIFNELKRLAQRCKDWVKTH